MQTLGWIAARALGAAALVAAVGLPVFGAGPEGKGDQGDQGDAQEEPKDAWSFLLRKYDADKDGVITRKEYTRDDTRWKNLDVDGDGKVVRAEFEGRGWKLDKDRPKAPKVGKRAPDFELEVVPWTPPGKKGETSKGDEPGGGERPKDDAKPPKPELVKLSSFKGKRPVALIFGSYT